MANDDQTTPQPPDSQGSEDPISPPPAPAPVNSPDQGTTQSAWNSSGPANNVSEPQDRTQLISRARSFLALPQIRLEDQCTKHKFLSDKGLSAGEIDDLMHELPPHVPQIPPRTYPQPPPSNLPNLLNGLARLFTWIAGGSAVVVLLYYRFLLPRITKTLQSRQALKSHHVDLLRQFSTSLSAFKEFQSESFSFLPRPLPFIEHAAYKHCHSLDEIVTASQKSSHQDIPDVSVLRCAIEELTSESEDRRPTTEDLFQAMISKLPWLQSQEGPKYQHDLWKTLSTSPLFQHTETTDGTTALWTYVPPDPPPAPKPSLLLSSLSTLLSALPVNKSEGKPFQHTLQTLTDFTGYITTQTYTLPSTSSFRIPGMGAGNLSPQEEEVRKEIRALKGLVLNRRSFMPTIPRPASTPALHPTDSMA